METNTDVLEKRFDFEITVFSDTGFDDNNLFIKVADLIKKIIPECEIIGGRSLVKDMMQQQERIDELESALKKAVEFEEEKDKAERRYADIHNNTDGVGIHFDYASAPVMPEWVNQAKQVLKPNK